MPEFKPPLSETNTAFYRPEPFLNQDFFSEFRDDIEINLNNLQRLWHFARKQYIALPYHNFPHALDVLKDSLILAKRYEHETGFNVDKSALVLASLLHDGGIHIPVSEHGFSTPEHYSAHLVEQNGHKYGFGDRSIYLAAQAVITTNIDSKPSTAEGKILMRSDLSNLGGNYKTSFIRNTLLIRDEAKWLAYINGDNFDEKAFLKDTIVTLSRYLDKDLYLGDFDRAWSDNSRANLQRLILGTAGGESLGAVRYVLRRSNETAGIFLGKSILKKSSEDT